MTDPTAASAVMTTEDTGRNRPGQIETMERILAIAAPDLARAMQEAAELAVHAFHADKVDAMFLERESSTLVALGTSDTPMGRRQHELGLHRMPLANGGRAVGVFESGEPFRSGHVDEDPDEVPGLFHGLGIRSEIIAPIDVDGVRGGVILASAAARDAFTEDDLRFLQAIGRWVGMVALRAELSRQVAEEAAERGRRVAAEELITVLAHDVRNLLTPLKARLDLVRRRARSDGRERDIRDLDEADRSAARLTRLMEDLLDVARLEGGAFAITPRLIDLTRLVQATASNFRSADRDVLIRAPDELEVFADPGALSQVIENLLSNSCKHSPDGTPVTVDVRTEPREDGPWAVVTVSDRGPGVPPDLIPRLFTRFAADSNSTGVGLGLYIAGQIVALHGGHITIDTEPGQGTQFHVALPVSGEIRDT